MAVKFKPIQKYKTDENGNQIEIDLYRGTDFEEIVAFLKENGTDKERAEFKKNCYLAAKKIPTGRKDKNGKEIMEIIKDEKGNAIMEKTDKLNWLYAKRKFFEKYAPEYVTTNKRVNKATLIADW